MFNLKKAVAYGPDIGLPKFTVAFFDAIDAFFWFFTGKRTFDKKRWT